MCFVAQYEISWGAPTDASIEMLTMRPHPGVSRLASSAISSAGARAFTS
jgi:hypothetical protein